MPNSRPIRVILGLALALVTLLVAQPAFARVYHPARYFSGPAAFEIRGANWNGASTEVATGVEPAIVSLHIPPEFRGSEVMISAAGMAAPGACHAQIISGSQVVAGPIDGMKVGTGLPAGQDSVFQLVVAPNSHLQLSGVKVETY